MRLSEHQIKATPTPIRRTTLSDGRGLELRMTPSGKRTWSLLYPFNGKKQRFTIGPYPSVKLKEARLLADKLRCQVANGQNPQELERIKHKTNINTVLWCYETLFASTCCVLGRSMMRELKQISCLLLVIKTLKRY